MYTQSSPLGQEDSIVTSVAVDGTAVDVSQAKKRKCFYLRNISLGGQIINIALSNTIPATTTAGILLNPNDTYTESNSEGFECWSGKITAIGSAAGGTLAVFER